MSWVSTTTEQTIPFSKLNELSTTEGTLAFVAPYDLIIVGARAHVGTAPTGSDLIVDVNKNGSTIYTTQANRPTIPDGSTTSGEATPDITAVAEDDEITVDIDQVGSSTAGSDLTVIISYV